MIEIKQSSLVGHKSLYDFFTKSPTTKYKQFCFSRKTYPVTTINDRYGNVTVKDKCKEKLHPLVIAALLGKKEQLDFILRQAPAKIIKKHLHLAFFYAATNGHIGIVKELLLYPTVQKNVNNSTRWWAPNERTNWNALATAAANGHAELVSFLLSNKDITDVSNYFALMLAITNNNASVLRALLDNDAIQQTLLNNFNLLIGFSVTYNHSLETVQTLWNYKALQNQLIQQPTPLINWTIFNNYHDFLHILLQNELLRNNLEKNLNDKTSYVDCNIKDLISHTIRKNHLPLLRELLNYEIFKKNISYRTLLVAIEENNLDMVNELLEQPIMLAHITLANQLSQNPALFIPIIRSLTIPQAIPTFNNFVTTYIEKKIIEKKIKELLKEKEIFNQLMPELQYNPIKEEEAQWWFYCLKYLIQKNDNRDLNTIKILLDIPAIQKLASKNINLTTHESSNELLRTANNVGNAGAANLLLALKEVYDLARQNHFYSKEAYPGFKLKKLAPQASIGQSLICLFKRKKPVNQPKILDATPYSQCNKI